jgi:hypothetical protein
VGSFSIVAIGTYAASTNFHQLRDTTFCRKHIVSLSAKSTFQLEKRTVFNLARGAGDGSNPAVNRRSPAKQAR